MNAVYPHTATLWCRLPEEDGRAGWSRHELRGVRFDEQAGAYRAAGGDRGDRSALLIVPARAMEGYVPPGRFEGGGWTLRPRDMVIMDAAKDEEPPKDARAVETVKTVRVGSTIHHLEVR